MGEIGYVCKHQLPHTHTHTEHTYTDTQVKVTDGNELGGCQLLKGTPC